MSSPRSYTRSNEWIKAKVDEKVGVRSHAVVTQQGRLFRRNRRRLRKANVHDTKDVELDVNLEVDFNPMEPLPSEGTEEVVQQTNGTQSISGTQGKSSTITSQASAQQPVRYDLVECTDHPESTVPEDVSSEDLCSWRIMRPEFKLYCYVVLLVWYCYFGSRITGT